MIIDFDRVLTKEFLLAHVSEEEIFTRYGVPVQDGVFRSPLRNDRHPTMNFYRRRNGKLMLHDHGGQFWGDCFDLVTKIHNISFGKALRLIASDFGLTDEVVIRDRLPAPPIIVRSTEACDLRVKRREWTLRDRSYWGRWDFRQETLDYFHISPIERAWSNDEPVYAYRKQGEEAYVYHFGQYDYKFYFPFRKVARFMHNNSYILQGYLQLPASGDVVVITKSYKDVAKLHEFGIAAVAPMSETVLPSEAHLEELAERFGRLVVLYDNDMPGRRSMVRLARRYQQQFKLELLLFPKGMPKDFTDYYEKKGAQSTLLLIEHVKTELNL